MNGKPPGRSSSPIPRLSQLADAPSMVGKCTNVLLASHCCTGYDRVHFWLLLPLQVHRTSLVPLAVPPPLESRQRPAFPLVMVPSALTSHGWLFWPLQSQVTNLVPLVVPRLLASRHLLP